MHTDPRKWNPFKFLRGAGRKPDADSPQSPSASDPWRVGLSDIPRLFSRDPWRAMEDFFHDPFAARGALVLRGEKRQDVRSEEDGCYRLERAYGTFTRTIPMPENADADHALAKFDKGVLTLTVPKQEASQSASHTIDIG